MFVSSEGARGAAGRPRPREARDEVLQGSGGFAIMVLILLVLLLLLLLVLWYYYFRGNRLSNTTCLTQAFFKSGE